MYIRNDYIKSVVPYIDRPVIKVITGMRRVGKSCFLKQIQSYLLQKSIKLCNIISINMESLEFDNIRDYKDLHEYILSKVTHIEGRCYIFIDEIQEIKNWEKTVISLFSENRFDIYISGSNAHLLSSELATLISGRYIEFPIYPFSFKEFIEYRKLEGNLEEHFNSYLRFGGLPGIWHFIGHEYEMLQYLESIYDTIILKDILKRFNIRNVAIFGNIVKFLFDNIGNILSAKKIADFLKSQRISISVDTVQNYISYLKDAYIIHKAPRYDIKGKKILKINDKFYLNDLGIRNAVIGYNDLDIAILLENIVYTELLRRGYKVTVGKNDDREIDFIATNKDKKYYIQVSYILATKETKEREISAFDNIADHFPKILLTLDKFHANKNINGILCHNIIDFLLDDQLL